MYSGNPIKYTSYDYQAIRADIDSDPNLVDKEDWWKRIFAGIGDAIGMHQNAGMNNAYLRTAFTRRAVVDILSWINFTLTPQTTASGNVILYVKNSAIFPFTLTGVGDMAASTQGAASSGSMRFEARISSQVVSAFSEAFTADYTTGRLTTPGARSYTTGEKVLLSNVGGALPTGLSAGTSYYVISVSNNPGVSAVFKVASSIANAYAGIAVAFSTNGSGTNTVALYSVQVPMYQQTTVAQYSVGQGDGITSYQQFNLSDVNVLTETLAVTINALAWTKVSGVALVGYGGSATVFRHLFNNDQSSYLEFGDGVYGAVAPNYPIFASYAYGGGSGSNVGLPNMVNSYAGANANIEGCSNPVAMTGGSDPMSIATAKAQGPMVAAAQNRVVSAADAQALVLAYGGMSLVQILANYYGPNSFGILAVATGGGFPDGTLQTNVINYITPLTLMGSALVAFPTATLVSQSPSVGVHLSTGASWAQVQPWVQLACSLFFTERGQEWISYYASNGIVATVTALNAWGGWSFGASDYSVITALITAMQNNSNFVQAFGDYITQDQFTTFIEESVPGIAYITVSAPSFPIALTALQICTLGTVTVVQV